MGYMDNQIIWDAKYQICAHSSILIYDNRWNEALPLYSCEKKEQGPEWCSFPYFYLPNLVACTSFVCTKIFLKLPFGSMPTSSKFQHFHGQGCVFSKSGGNVVNLEIFDVTSSFVIVWLTLNCVGGGGV